MSQDRFVQHYVCTLEEARTLVDRYPKYWVSNCGCREGGDGCRRSRTDVCLQFKDDTAAGGTGRRRLSRAEVEGILDEAGIKGLVPRPFRDPAAPGEAEGICFCCDCCCWYFKKHEEECDRGRSIEQTDLDICTHCGDCVGACYFGARAMDDGRLGINRERCYGCGLCAGTCPVCAITMVARPAG